MERYKVTGMTCAACQARVEKAVQGVDGVTGCAVSLLTNSMSVEGTARPEAVVQAVTEAGYGASLQGAAPSDGGQEADLLQDTESPRILRRLLASLLLLLPLLYVSMGQMLWQAPLPGFLAGNPAAVGLYELLLAGLIMVINQHYYISGLRGVLHGAANMDTLVALGSLASFGYSVYVLFALTAAVQAGETVLVRQYQGEFYFEAAAMIVTLITLGKLLEAKAKGRTTNALKSLLQLTPKTAVLQRQGQEITVPVAEVQPGDIFVVKPGAQIPVDGVVREGFSAVNEAAFTGESLPVEKKAGEKVAAGTVNLNGRLQCEATGVGEATALAKIIRLVSDAAATKAPIAKIADRVSGVFVPVVVGLACLAFCVWLLLGAEPGYALARGIAVLVISCPCALGLATPVAIMVGSGVAAKAGILFKTAAALEQTGGVQLIALDKTGTITTGQMQVVASVPAAGVTAAELWQVAAALEASSEHPISRAICSRAREEGVALQAVTDFTAVAGNGLQGRLNGLQAYGGNAAFLRQAAGIDVSPLQTQAAELAATGKTPVFFASADRLLGLLAVADTIKPDSHTAIAELQQLGLYVVMLTGDNTKTAQAIAAEAGVDYVVAGVRPDGKEKIIAKLQEQGRVAMVGDGINDAPALTRADVGIAIGAGTDIAIEAADVVLAKSSLRDVAAAIRLSRATLRNIHENLFWAFFYNVIGIPLAAGCFVAALGWSLNPMFGAAAMSLSSFCVVSNALRLNWVKVYESKADKVRSDSLRGRINLAALLPPPEPEETTAEVTELQLTVNGMMCEHCEKRVKKFLEKLDGVQEATAQHAAQLVTLRLTQPVDDEALRTAIEKAGYEYGGRR